MMTEVCLKFWVWGWYKILRVRFGWDFETNFCSRLWGLSLVEILKLNFGQHFEAVVWSILWGWSLFNILKLDFDRLLIWIRKPLLRWKHSTLVSVLPLAMFQPEFIKLDKNARFSPIVKFSGFSTYPIFHSGRQHPPKSLKTTNREKCLGRLLFSCSDKNIRVGGMQRWSIWRDIPRTPILGGGRRPPGDHFPLGVGKIYSQLYFPASWEVSHFSIPINEPADLLKWMAHSTFSGNCESFQRYEMLMGCPWSYLQETTFFH